MDLKIYLRVLEQIVCIVIFRDMVRVGSKELVREIELTVSLVYVISKWLVAFFKQ